MFKLITSKIYNHNYEKIQYTIQINTIQSKHLNLLELHKVHRHTFSKTGLS